MPVLATLLAALTLSSADPATVVQHGLRLPAGFEVIEFSDDKLAPDIHCLTVDRRGRVIVSGRGYLRLLIDDNGDGKADRAEDFAHPPGDGAHGLCWDGKDLYAVGEGGLRVFRDADGQGRTRPSEVLFRCRTGSEHLAHAVQRGPDGWLYLLVGDQTGISRAQITRATSPVKDPVGGCVVRFSSDFRGVEVVADGFRNPYGMDFGIDGELFTYDSDNERCVSLPWYEPTRAYHVLPGANHGWVAPRHASTWRRPPYFLDIAPPLATLGRGSPTGVVAYRHTQFPAKYHGGLFLLDWTFGQVHFLPLDKAGSSYRGTPEVFLRSVGDNGFAPTAGAINPVTGDLYLAIGGRGTRGGIYRIRYAGGIAKAHILPVKARSLDWRAGLADELLRTARGADLFARRQALEAIARHQERFTSEQIQDSIVVSAVENDRGMLHACANLLRLLDPKSQDEVGKRLVAPLARRVGWLARPSFDANALVIDRKLPASLRLDGVRLVQLAMGDIGDPKAKGSYREGYTRRSSGPSVPDQVLQHLREAFPSGDADLDRELARTLALIEDDSRSTFERTLGMLTSGSHPLEDIHYLAVLSLLRVKRGPVDSRAVAQALLRLDEKIGAHNLNRDRNWPSRLAEMHAELTRRDPGLNAALLALPEFGRPDHALWCRTPGFDRQRAAEVFLARAAREESFAWNVDLIRLVGELPAPRSLPVLRTLWNEQGLDEAILPVLARHGQPEDRARLTASLTLPQLTSVRLALDGLDQLPVPDTNPERQAEARALAQCLRILPPGKEEDRLRSRVLVRLSSHAREILDTTKAEAWFAKTYPEQARQLAGPEVDVVGWRKRLDRVVWDKGDVKKGELVYRKASCISCHSGVAALGPDLRGVAGRFSRDDLFTAIVQPSKDVSPRYRSTRLTTSDGKVYQGIIVYEAVDGVLLLTGPGQNVRIKHATITERKLTTASLMPAGLLDRLADGEIADLYAYLRSLKGK